MKILTKMKQYISRVILIICCIPLMASCRKQTNANDKNKEVIFDKMQ